MFPVDEQQPCVDLARHTARELRRGGMVHRHGDRSSQYASEERRNPLAGISPPQQHSVLRSNAPALELASALGGQPRHVDGHSLQ